MLSSLGVEGRLLLLFVVGVFVGTQINRGIYRLAWHPRNIGPWSSPPPGAPPRRRQDALPIIGWYFLRREAPIHGKGYWIRPLLIELAVGIVFAALYWFEVVNFGVARFNAGHTTLHVQYFTHLLLFSLMMVATFIDFDEQTIPDSITLPGTLLGLLIAAVFPTSRTHVLVPALIGNVPDELHIGSGVATVSDSGWPVWLDGPAGLGLGIACFVAWSIAIMPWIWTTRRGLIKAVQYAWVSLHRHGATVPLAILAFVGSIAICGAWFVGGNHWESMLSSLVGMAVGGGTIWAVRIVGTQALGQEAMGFGDVTLMAMVGAFTGWQPTLMIFFLAPFSAIFIAVAQYAFTRRHDIAFGPYLCLSTVIWVLFSYPLWKEYGSQIFSLGWFVPAVGATGLLLMGGMLGGWRIVRDTIMPMPDEEPEAVSSVQASLANANAKIPAGSDSQGLICSRGPRGNHPLRTTASLQRQVGPIPPVSPLSHRPLPPHAPLAGNRTLAP